MKEIREGIFFLVLFLLLLVFGTHGCSTAPLPTTLNIIPPSADVPPEIAAFSGLWKGRWDGLIDTILVVEKVDIEKAEVIFSIGEAPRWLRGRYFYTTAKVSHTPLLLNG